MFEKPGWREAQALVGPVPDAPCSQWSLSELLQWAPRAPFTPAWFGALQQIDASALDALQRLRLVQAWDRFRQGSDAAFLTAVGTVDIQSCQPEGDRAACPGGSRCSHDWSTEEVAAALHLAPITASLLLRDARELAGQCLVLREAVAEGRLPAYAARLISLRLLSVADSGVVDAVLARVMSRIGLVTPSQLVRLAEVTLEALRDPAEALAAHLRARRSGTGITHGQPLDDGMASATITASVAEIAELFAWAREFTTRNRDADDTRTVGERRVHALLDCLHQGTVVHTSDSEVHDAAAASRPSGSGPSGSGPSGSGPSGSGPSGSGPSGTRSSGAPGARAGAGSQCGGSTDESALVSETWLVPVHGSGLVPAPAQVLAPVLDRRDAQRPAISLRLIMSADTLLGRDNDPAWLSGVGVIPAYLARTLAIAPESLQRALVDNDGTLLNLGRRHRLPTSALAEHIRARDHFCTGLGCTRSSEKAELDHIIPWAKGGQTNVDDLHPNCPRHHRSQDAGWAVERTSQDTSWTSPTGITYVTVLPPPPPPPPPPQPPPQPPQPPPPPSDRDRDPLEDPPPGGKPPSPPPMEPPF